MPVAVTRIVRLRTGAPNALRVSLGGTIAGATVRALHRSPPTVVARGARALSSNAAYAVMKADPRAPPGGHSVYVCPSHLIVHSDPVPRSVRRVAAPRILMTVAVALPASRTSNSRQRAFVASAPATYQSALRGPALKIA